MNNALKRKRGIDKNKRMISQKRYMSKQKQYNVILNPERDGDIINWLAMQDNKQGAIREAIRVSMRDDAPDVLNDAQ